MISWPRNVPLQQVLLLLGEALKMEKRVEDDRCRPVRLFVVFLSGRLFYMISVAFVEVGQPGALHLCGCLLVHFLGWSQPLH